MQKKAKSLRNKLVRSKLFIQRALGYIAILNSGMILFLVLSRLENYNMDIRLETWFIPIFLGTILLMVLFGYFEDRLGFFEEETSEANKRNPALVSINRRLDNIEELLKKSKK
jgi:hypothetical protein